VECVVEWFIQGELKLQSQCNFFESDSSVFEPKSIVLFGFGELSDARPHYPFISFWCWFMGWGGGAGIERQELRRLGGTWRNLVKWL
jgi:hypothetical protein